MTQARGGFLQEATAKLGLEGGGVRLLKRRWKGFFQTEGATDTKATEDSETSMAGGRTEFTATMKDLKDE